jgi:N-acetylglucosaminyldiphosphoundecaprenol N-acetyl-beta-D-mannosaminyltransferase
MAEKDQDFKDALSHSDVLLPDGIGIVAAVKFLNKQNIKKIAGADVHSYFLKKLDAAKGSCFYLGSSEETLVRIKKRSTRNILILGSILILRHSNQSSPRKIQIKWLRQ